MIYQTPDLTPATLALFDGGLAWPDILALTNGRGLKWWRERIIEAEGHGFIRWKRRTRKEPGRWTLTDAGRELVRLSAAGCA